MPDEELNAPAPEPLRFDIDEPELLDDDMVEILLLPEASALQAVSMRCPYCQAVSRLCTGSLHAVLTHLQLGLPRCLR